MADALRVTVTHDDAEVVEGVKDQFFKALYEHAGTKVIFEVPGTAQADADAIVAFAKDKGCEATIEEHTDELGDAEPVDFW